MKFDEPKEQLEKEIKNQKSKLERITTAYVNGVFELEEYKEQRNIVENAIKELENELATTPIVSKNLDLLQKIYY